MHTLIVVDIGNTSVHLAYVRGGRIIKIQMLKTSDISRRLLHKPLSAYRYEKVIVCSVVPQLTKLFLAIAKNIVVIGQDIKVPIRCFYNKKKVGMDRLVAAYSANYFYEPTRLVIDCGTAITLDFLAKEGAYLGGLILPGIGSTLRVLSSCALLPAQIKLQKKYTRGLIPKDTDASIACGIEQGFSAMLNALVKRYKRMLKISGSQKVVITGGDAAYIKDQLTFPYIYDPLLVLKGLIILGTKKT